MTLPNLLAQEEGMVIVQTTTEGVSETSEVEKAEKQAGYRIFYSIGGVDYYMCFAPASTFPTGTDDSGSATVDANFWIAETPVTYGLWYEVRMWAERNGYTFANDGREGGDGDWNSGNTGGKPSGRRNEPVTMVNWYDSIVWCNAFSKYLGYKSSLYCSWESH